jgi:hypothetical protein
MGFQESFMEIIKNAAFRKKILVFGFFSACTINPLTHQTLIPFSFAAFEDTGLGARQRGLGDSLTALDDAGGVLLNPALPGGARKFETGAHFEAGTRSSLGPLDFESYAVDSSVPRTGYGKLGTMSFIGRYRSLAGGDLKEKMFGLGWATWQLKKLGTGVLDLGANFKIMQLASQITDDSKMALGADFGVLLRINARHSVGLSFLNFNSPSFKAGALNDKAPRTMRLGVAEKAEDYSITLDAASRSGAGGYKGNITLSSGFEYVWRTYRYGIFTSRTGLSLAQRASLVSLGAGYRHLASEISYAMLLPVNGAITPGHALSVNIRFGDQDLESEYEKIIKREVKYRKDLVEALDQSARREGILRDELTNLRGEIDRLNSSLRAARDQKAEAAQSRDKLEAIMERQRRAEAELKSLEEKRQADKLYQRQSDFSRDWQDYVKMRAGGAPKDVLRGALQRLIGRYQDAGIDISPATVELQALVKQ